MTSFLLTNLLLVTCVFSQSDLLNEDLKQLLNEAKHFEDIFEFVQNIELKVDLIGEISQIDVAQNGNLVICDRLTHKTWLFDSEGNLIKDIHAGNNFPGIKWLPRGAWFGHNHTFLVQVDGTNHFFLFDSTGNYIKAIPTNYTAQYRDFVIDQQGYIYGYSTNAAEFSVKKIDPDGEIVAKGGIFPVEYRNFIMRTSDAGGLVIDKEGNIYQYNACGPEIYKLSTSLEKLSTFDETPSYYKKLTRDFPDFASNPTAFMKKANRLLVEATMTYSVHLILNNLFVIQYVQSVASG